MPIPLGILAAAGFSPAVAGGSFDLLETALITTNTASVEFTNIASQYASTYQHLQIRLLARTTRSNDIDNIRVQFNGDTGANYDSHWLLGNGSSVSSSRLAGSYIELYRPSAATATSGVFGVNVIDILDPFESKNKTIRNFSGVLASSTEVRLQSGLWMNTNQLSSVKFYLDSTWNFVAGSRVSLYGVK